MFLKLLDLLYLDGYTSLVDKYRDKERDTFREERHFANSNYNYYMAVARADNNYKYMMAMRKAKCRGDYLTLYYMELALDGNEFAIQWLNKDWEN